MRVAAFIPARGGSERVKRKNLREVGGKSLLRRAVESAAGCASIVVSTQDESIMDHVHYWDDRPREMIAISRPHELATSHSRIEDAMRHWWRRLPLDARPDVLVLLQPTSPLRTSKHVREAVELLTRTGADSVVSVTLNPKAHFEGRSYPREGWREFRPFRPLDSRPRTQDMRDIVQENGAIYVTRRAAWEKSWNRMSGVIAEYRMSEWESIDIDTEEDLEMANRLVGE